jgi:heterodisulfide reductase subunit C
MSSTFTKCLTKFCKERASKKLWRSPYCSKCRSRRWRANKPVESAFHRLKHHAKERGHKFTLTLEYFRAFCVASDYIAKRGKSGTSASIDRINDALGYEPGNLQVITLSENSRKRFVPYFKNKQEMEDAIAETERKVREAYPETAA